MSASLDDILTSTPTGTPGQFTCEVRDGWQAGRGAFGGLVLGILTRAITDTVGDATPMRSLTAAIPAPVEVGATDVEVRIVRVGSALTTVTAELRQGGEVRALATAVCAKARASATQWRTEARPAAPPWQDVPVAPFVPGMSPPFTRYLPYRLVGPMPFSRSSTAAFLGYVDGPAARRDAAWLVAMADAYYPAAQVVFGAPRPTATSTFTMEFIEPLTDDDLDAPVLVHARCPAAYAGYAFETRELWGQSGQLLARNHQTFVVIK